MPSNLRAKPIQGHLTDSAGNVIRNSLVTVKIMTPIGAQVVASAKANDDGYFVTTPLTSGNYFIYESGVLVSQIIHTATPETIQCFKADPENYFPQRIQSFNTLLAIRPVSELRKFKMFIQIESDEVNTALYGNSFQIYDSAINYGSQVVQNDLYWIGKFFDLDTDSRITTTRFDIEYFSPITSVDTSYKRIRWAGMPAIRFIKDSKLVVPLDYFSFITSLPKKVSNNGLIFSNPPLDLVKISSFTSGQSAIIQSTDLNNAAFGEIYDTLSYGDVVKLILTNGKIFYGIFYLRETSGSDRYIYVEILPSSRFTSNTDIIVSDTIDMILVFDGIFSGMQSIDSLVPERFTVVENVSAQNSDSELYNYSNQINV